MKVFRGSILLIVLGACAVENVGVVSQPIVGGELSEPSEFPATGMLVVGEHLVCTATLIAPDVALTAAHCLRPPIYGGFGFSLDTTAADGITGIVPVAITHQHPEFDDSVDDFVDLAVRNDIGVILLAQPILDVVPEQIDRSPGPAPVATGDALSLCGYGRSLWHTGADPLKRDAEVFIDRTASFEFSTTAADPQPCTGDSGGPLFANTPDGRRIIGVVSRAVGRSNMCDTGAIITRVEPYADWINLASQDRNTGGCNAGGGGAVGPLGLIGLTWALAGLRRRRRAAR